jgi:hypothetical protein
MHIAYRSYLTAGVAAVGAGAIALSPVQVIPNQLGVASERAVSNLAVGLAAQVNPIELWQQVIQTTQDNIATLQAFKASVPYPLINTIKGNIQTYISALPNTDYIISTIKNNINTFFYAPWSPGPCATDPCGDPAFYEGLNISNVPITNKVPFLGQLSQRQLYALLPAVLPADQAATLAPILAFTATTYSGQVMALLGMLAGPVVQLSRSFTTIKTALADGDTATALNELINIPALTTNAFLNGIGHVDLTDLVNKIMPLPEEIEAIGVNLGGMFTPPVKYEGTLEDPTSLSAGTLFDGVATTAGVSGLTVTTPGQPVGWWAAAIGLGQYLAPLMTAPPPPPSAAVAPTASVRAAAAVEAPAVEAPAAAPAVAADPAPAVVDVAPEEAPAPQVISDPTPAKQSAASDNDGKAGNASRTHHKGARHAS